MSNREESGGSSMMSKIGVAVAAAAAVGLGFYAARSASSSGEPDITEEKNRNFIKSSGAAYSSINDYGEDPDDGYLPSKVFNGEFRSGPPGKQIKWTCPSEKPIEWTCPDAGWMKFNVDGSVLPDQGNLATCGGVMRDAAGKYITGFARQLEPCNVTEAELWGIVSAMELAWKGNFKKLIIESDSEQAVSFVNNKAYPTKINKSLSDLVSKAQNLLKQNWDEPVRVEHIYREGNRAANFMTKKARRLSSDLKLHEFPVPPEELVPILKEDKMEVSFPGAY